MSLLLDALKQAEKSNLQARQTKASASPLPVLNDEHSLEFVTVEQVPKPAVALSIAAIDPETSEIPEKHAKSEWTEISLLPTFDLTPALEPVPEAELVPVVAKPELVVESQTDQGRCIKTRIDHRHAHQSI